ncbi:hypothetical protein Hsar01_01719 [Haloferula sargassicola]|uniref:GYF domain-containing protein n=1 Tax=Haloferula sargassicola TaxID=490096 RepID=A0ABP9UP95_9BACT
MNAKSFCFLADGSGALRGPLTRFEFLGLVESERIRRTAEMVMVGSSEWRPVSEYLSLQTIGLADIERAPEVLAAVTGKEPSLPF